MLCSAIRDIHGETSHHGTGSHSRTSRLVVAIFIGTNKCWCHHANRFITNCISNRSTALRDNACDRLRERINTSVSGHGWRHAVGKNRVNNCELGTQISICDSGFAASRRIRNYRTTRYFRARTGRSWQRNQRNSWNWIFWFTRLKFTESYTKLGTETRSLSGIDDGTSTKCDDGLCS